MSTAKDIMEISNPRRILAVSLTDSAQHLSDVIKGMFHLPLRSSPSLLHLTSHYDA